MKSLFAEDRKLEKNIAPWSDKVMLRVHEVHDSATIGQWNVGKELFFDILLIQRYWVLLRPQCGQNQSISIAGLQDRSQLKVRSE